MYAVPIGFGLSGDDVDDILSHVVVRAWTSKTAPDNPRTWVTVVAANKARDIVKHSSRSRRVSFDIDSMIGSTCADAIVAEGEHERQVARLRNALRKLKDGDRRAVVLRYLHGKTFDEIGKALGISHGLAFMRCARGVRILARLFTLEPTPTLDATGKQLTPLPRFPRVATWRTLPQNSGTAHRIDPGAGFAAARMLGAL